MYLEQNNKTSFLKFIHLHPFCNATLRQCGSDRPKMRFVVYIVQMELHKVFFRAKAIAMVIVVIIMVVIMIIC